MSDHYYDPKTAEPRHFVKKKDGSGNRPANIWDCKKNGWLPSPTTVLKRVLAAHGLVEWRIRTAVAAVMTAPRKPDEELDAFIARVIDEERQHEQESDIAKDKGAEIHDAIQKALESLGSNDATGLIETYRRTNPFVFPVVDEVLKSGHVVHTEKVLVNTTDGYAGTVDCVTENDECITVWDFKTSKNLPKKDAYDEHRYQASAYAKALGSTGDKRVECRILYISKSDPGQIKVCVVEDWPQEFRKFKLLLDFFILQNDLPKPASLESKLPF